MSGSRVYALFVLLLFAVMRVDSAIAQYAGSGPLLPAERQVGETARSVTAQEYRDAYCAKWTDGCSVCERATIKDEPRCRTIGTSTCERVAIECKVLLKTVGRVCLAYYDGCNMCFGGSCWARGCSIQQADGTFRQKDPNFRCTTLRRERYDDADKLFADLQGHWKLTDPRGRTCEIVNGFGVSLTPACIALGDPILALRWARMAGEIFQLTRDGGKVLLSFDTTNPDDLVGIGSSQGYRLIRLEAEPIDLRSWEGSWRMWHDAYACELFLMMRPRVTGPRPLHDFVQEPRGLIFASNCLDPTDLDHLRISHLYNAIPPLLLPIWTDWRTEGHAIVFADRNGRITRFTPNADGTWVAELPQNGSRAITMRLERAAH